MIRVVACLAVVLTACPTGGAIDPTYQGEPIATLHGKITLPDSAPTPAGVRLAIVWYASLSQPSQPNSIVTEDLTYQGSFPADFTFSLYNPPPENALVAKPDGSKQAFGILVAYSDDNRNHKLDPVLNGHAPLDTMLGATVSFFDFTRPGYWLEYSDTVPQEGSGWPAGSTKGFNLIQANSDAKGHSLTTHLPFSESIPLTLSGENELNALLCEVDFATHPRDPNPLGACGILATPNVLRVGVAFSRVLLDSAAAWSTTDSALITVSDGVRWVDDAGVLINGQPSVAMGEGQYAFTGPLDEGFNTASVTADGYAPVSVDVSFPGQKPLIAPARGAHLQSGSKVTVEWPSADSFEYRSVNIVEPDGTVLFHAGAGVDAPEVTVSTSDPIAYVGEATVRLRTYGVSKTDRFGSSAAANYTHERSIVFVP